jgi:LacI family transcriptional regulator
LAYVKETGYQTNMVAKSLRTGKTKIIGMLVEDISDPFFSSIARVVEEKAYKLGYKIFNSSTENDTIRARDLIKVFRERQVDGYIIAPSPGIEEEIQQLVDDNFPVVLFDRYFPGLPTHNIIIDNAGGAYEAMRHFVENGYRSIGFVTLDSTQVQMQERLNGYLRATSENSLQPFIQKVPYDTALDKHDKIVEQVKAFLHKNPALDSILFATNYLAIAGLQALKDLNLTIPGNIAVIGFDDNTHFSLFSPSVTAVAQPVEEMSAKVMEQLMICIKDDNRKTKNTTIRLPTKLVIRESSLRRNGVEQ